MEKKGAIGRRIGEGQKMRGRDWASRRCEGQ